jgi:hypothetical protein
MCNKYARLAFLFLLTFLTLGFGGAANANFVKGIYLTQTTMEDTHYLKYLIEHAKAVGITTFVVDLEIPSKLYAQNIKLLKENDINYVARIIVFPSGGTPEKIKSQAYWEKRYKLIQAAVSYGAQQIQLDYIRYSTKQHASSDNAKDIVKVVQFYKDKLTPQGIPLQADVFGISSYGESKHIGQNLRMMASTVDALCPMVYPSHFEPYRIHAVSPYQTIYLSLRALRSQFDYKMPVKLYAYIEISNYRYPLPGNQRHAYILAEMKAANDAGADGYYVWSAHNKYDYLFTLLSELQKQSPEAQQKTLQTAVDQSTKIHVNMNEPKVAITDDNASTKLAGGTSTDKNAPSTVMNDDETPWAHAGTDGVESGAFPDSL